MMPYAILRTHFEGDGLDYPEITTMETVTNDG